MFLYIGLPTFFLVYLPFLLVYLLPNVLSTSSPSSFPSSSSSSSFSSSHPQGLHLARYSMDVQGQGRLTCLDDNHSHFLLVDDGTHGRYGVEIELRSRLEKLISQKPLGNSGEMSGDLNVSPHNIRRHSSLTYVI